MINGWSGSPANDVNIDGNLPDKIQSSSFGFGILTGKLTSFTYFKYSTIKLNKGKPKYISEA